MMPNKRATNKNQLTSHLRYFETWKSPSQPHKRCATDLSSLKFSLWAWRFARGFLSPARVPLCFVRLMRRVEHPFQRGFAPLHGFCFAIFGDWGLGHGEYR